MLLKKFLLSIICIHTIAHGMEFEETASQMLEAIENNDLFQLAFLSGQNKNNIMDSAFSPLFLAANKDKWDIVEILLKQGVNPNNEKGVDFLLDMACKKRNLTAVNLLLKYNANVDIHDELFRETPLHHITTGKNSIKLSSEQPTIATKLLSCGANPNFKDLRGETPFYKLIWYIVCYGLFVNRDCKDLDEIKQRMLAEELINIFLSYGADINIENREGKSPLNIATSNKELTAYMTALYKTKLKNSSITITLHYGKAQDVVEQLTQLDPHFDVYVHTIVPEKRILKLIGEESKIERIAKEIREWDLECGEIKEHCDQEIHNITSEIRKKMQQRIS